MKQVTAASTEAAPLKRTGDTPSKRYTKKRLLTTAARKQLTASMVGTTPTINENDGGCKPTATGGCLHHNVPPLPNGDFPSWKFFLENGGYFSVSTPSGKESKVSVMAVPKQQQTMAFVFGILNPVGDYWWRRGWKSTQVRFHNLVKQLRKEIGVEAPRDRWESCLPPRSSDSYEFASLFLMLCSALIPDERLVPCMESIFSGQNVTPQYVLEMHALDPLFWEKALHDLGRQISNAKNVVLAAATTIALGRVPRNYTTMVLNYKGVGPKMALVTVQSSYNDIVSNLLCAAVS
jgi:endonuclease III